MSRLLLLENSSFGVRWIRVPVLILISFRLHGLRQRSPSMPQFAHLSNGGYSTGCDWSLSSASPGGALPPPALLCAPEAIGSPAPRGKHPEVGSHSPLPGGHTSVQTSANAALMLLLGTKSLARGVSLQLSPVILHSSWRGRNLTLISSYSASCFWIQIPLVTISAGRARNSLPLCLCQSLPGPDCAGLNLALARGLAQMPSKAPPSPPKHRNWSLARTPIPVCVSFFWHFITSCLDYNCTFYFPCCFGSFVGKCLYLTHPVPQQLPAHGGSSTNTSRMRRVVFVGGWRPGAGWKGDTD